MGRIERAFAMATLAYVVAVAAGVIARDWQRERARVVQVVIDTKTALNAKYGSAAAFAANIAAEHQGEVTSDAGT